MGLQEDLFLRQLKELIVPKLKALRLIRDEYGKELDKGRSSKYTRKFFDMSEKAEYTLDDQSWSDLDMDHVIMKVDRTYSSVGEAALYGMLRNPLLDEKKLIERSKIIEFFKFNEKVRTKIQHIYFKLGRDRKNTFLDMIENDLIINKSKYYIYTFLGKVLPVLIILGAIFIDTRLMMVLLGLTCVNMLINNSEKNNVKSHGILYLRDMINSAKKLSNFNNEEISCYTDKIKAILKEIRAIDVSTKLISFANMWGGLFEAISVIFLLEETAYYKVSSLLKEKKETLMELYGTLGEVEALISIASYQSGLNGQYSTPKFKKDLTLNIVDGMHPLLECGVANSIHMKKKGMVLTGTNMSGKSTFLRMIGINMLFAETFNFVLAKEYEASFFNIVSSISPNDDVTKGKSFYMAEAESILRIINALKKDVPVFCPIDEIFRGTNPVERISASAEILTHINKGKSISIVATHDRELVDILKKNYEFYYFSEKVDKKEGLAFDYKLKEGVSKTRNAIKLLDYIGYPKEITDKAFKRAGTIEGFI